MNKKLVIFDGNHLAYRAFYKFANLKTLDGVRTAVIYGMPYVAESLIRRLSPDEVVVVFDGGRSQFRLDLLPTYKQRDQKLGFDKADFYRQRDVGMELFQAMGLRIVQKRYFEADDLIAMVARRYANANWNVTIVSGDKDFNQLIQQSCNYLPTLFGEISIYNTGKAKYYTYRNLEKELGYRPEQTVDYLSLLGDKSDKIPGYPGIGPVKASQLLKEYGSIQNFLKSDDKFGKVDKVELKKVWKLNRKLIDIKYFYRKFLIKEEIPWVYPNYGFDLDKLKILCGSYEINSFLKPQFIKTFKKLGQ